MLAGRDAVLAGLGVGVGVEAVGAGGHTGVGEEVVVVRAAGAVGGEGGAGKAVGSAEGAGVGGSVVDGALGTLRHADLVVENARLAGDAQVHVVTQQAGGHAGLAHGLLVVGVGAVGAAKQAGVRC